MSTQSPPAPAGPGIGARRLRPLALSLTPILAMASASRH